jgi:hypothetical protein
MTIPPSDLVLIDTCIWVGFFNRNQSAERITVDPLLDDDRAAITGMILAEILQGFRRDEQADWVASSLKGLHDLEPTWDDWRVAAKLGRLLVAKRSPLTTDRPCNRSYRTQKRLLRPHNRSALRSYCGVETLST